MPVELREEQGGRLCVIQLSGKLTREDYGHLVPAMELLIKKHGKISLLVRLHDFHGWTVGAFWEDLKFDVKHFRDFERLAVVGEKKWHKRMAQLCKPFTTAKIRYFDQSQAAEALEWVKGTKVAVS